MILEKISLETSDELRGISCKIGSPNYLVGISNNTFIAEHVEGYYDHQLTTMVWGMEGTIGLEARNRLGHSILRLEIFIPPSQRAFITGACPTLLTEKEGDCLANDIIDFVNTPSVE